MDYLWLKALHIVAVVTWGGGMLVVAVTITAAFGGRAQQETATHSAVPTALRFELVALDKKIKAATRQHNSFLKELRLPLLPPE